MDGTGVQPKYKIDIYFKCKFPLKIIYVLVKFKTKEDASFSIYVCTQCSIEIRYFLVKIVNFEFY